MSLRIYGNRLLKTLPGRQTRPTSARVERLFLISGKVQLLVAAGWICVLVAVQWGQKLYVEELI